jgi:3-carboxy-cis,cis-muconate cycloisomerase
MGALGCELGLMTGSLGKIAVDIALLGQYEVGEVAEPSEPGRGGSSAMPHKRNPVASMVAIAAAHRAPQRVAALLAPCRSSTNARSAPGRPSWPNGRSC